MLKKLILLSLYTLLIYTSACGQVSDKVYHSMLKGLYANTVPVITAEELYSKLKQPNKTNYVLLDTRTKEEFQVSHLQNARFADYDTFNVSDLQGVSKASTVVVYCSVGYRSEKIGEKLFKAGFTNVYNLYGGIFEWVNKGYTVYDAKGPTTKVHAYSKSWGVWLRKGDKVYE